MDCDWMGLKHDIHGQFESIIPQDNKYQMSYFKKLPNARNGISAEVNSNQSIFMQNLMSIFVTQNVDING